MDIESLSEILGEDVKDLLPKFSRLNLRYDLGIEDYYQLTSLQYNILRSAFDQDYMVSVLKGGRSGSKYNYANSEHYKDVRAWVTDRDLNGRSTADIREILPEYMRSISVQALSAAMKEEGYTIKVRRLAGGKQGRRWHKYKLPLSFF